MNDSKISPDSNGEAGREINSGVIISSVRSTMGEVTRVGASSALMSPVGMGRALQIRVMKPHKFRFRLERDG